MDDFGSQVGSQLDTGLENLTYVIIRKRNIVFRVDLLTTRKKVKWKNSRPRITFSLHL